MIDYDNDNGILVVLSRRRASSLEAGSQPAARTAPPTSTDDTAPPRRRARRANYKIRPANTPHTHSTAQVPHKPQVGCALAHMPGRAAPVAYFR